VTYTGNGAALASGGNAITGIGFQPDFVWIKNRTVARNHRIFDSVRGELNSLVTNSTVQEQPYSEYLSSFDVDGFTIGSDPGVNESAQNFVAWTASLPNTKTSGWAGSPTITPTMEKYNPTPGMSIVKYTGNGVDNSTLPHSLGSKPGMIIIKRLDIADSWVTRHKGLPDDYNLYLQATNSQSADYKFKTSLNSTTLIGIHNGSSTNALGGIYIAYIFSESDFIKIGSYMGNGSADGPMINEGIEPKFFLGKASNWVSYWQIFDSTRDPYNVANHVLVAHDSLAESTTFHSLDFLKTGIKHRSSNLNGVYNYVYLMIGQPI